MKKVTSFYLESCPYCRQAQKVLKELIEENSLYGAVEIDWIEETEHPDIIEKYDYNTVPCMFIGDEKIYEAHLFETHGKCKRNVKHVLDTVLE